MQVTASVAQTSLNVIEKVPYVATPTPLTPVEPSWIDTLTTFIQNVINLI